ncbi:hypothetical protein OUZ56_009917 [Daphnia magna]|uniref:THAP-type domain-containing protein n=1 Tax=Daphnia magna TaxID=35525 RepID=A0ABR0AH86_9CRUS|nr:hypothetical protein OUZ56_009917 [Daphnia magna]
MYVPKDDTLFIKRKKAAKRGRSDKTLSKNNHICSKHFLEQDIVKGEIDFNDSSNLRNSRMAKNVTSDIKPESHTGQDIIDMQDASHGSYNVTENVQTVTHNDLETTVNLQGKSSNNGTASDTNEDPANVQAFNDLEVTVDMQRESSNKNGTLSDTNEDPENVKQNSLQESIGGLILDPTEAKTPNASWCWLPAEVEAFGKERRENLEDAMDRFDSSSLCFGCDPKFGEQLATMKPMVYKD